MSIFQILPIVSTDTTLPIIPLSDIRFLNSKAESLAYGHWELGGNSGSLVDIANGRSLTPQNGSYLPAYNGGYISHNVSAGRALNSDYLEAPSAGEYTICAVQRIPADAGTLIIPSGNLAASSPTPSYGGSMLMGAASGGKRALLDTHRNWTNSQATALEVNSDQWCFLATSIKYGTSGTRTINNMVGKAGVATTYTLSSGVALYNPHPTQPIALGNALFGVGTLGDIHTAEFIIFPLALSLDELAAVYGRSKSRAARRGIVI